MASEVVDQPGATPVVSGVEAPSAQISVLPGEAVAPAAAEPSAPAPLPQAQAQPLLNEGQPGAVQPAASSASATGYTMQIEGSAEKPKRGALVACSRFTRADVMQVFAPLLCADAFRSGVCSFARSVCLTVHVFSAERRRVCGCCDRYSRRRADFTS